MLGAASIPQAYVAREAGRRRSPPRPPRTARWLLAASVVAHLVVGSAIYVARFWRIERIDPRVTIVLPPIPPAAPPRPPPPRVVSCAAGVTIGRPIE